MCEWIEDGFDPQDFFLEAVNRRLQTPAFASAWTRSQGLKLSPFVQQSINVLANSVTRSLSVPSLHEQPVVGGVPMPDGCDHRCTQCFLVQDSPCGSSAYSATATNGCMLSNPLRFFGRTTWNYLLD